MLAPTRLVWLAALGLLLSACWNSSPAPDGLSEAILNLDGSTTRHRLGPGRVCVAHLSGAAVVPPSGSQGRGEAVFKIRQNRIAYGLRLSALSEATGARIHEGAPGLNGPARVDLTVFSPGPSFIARGVITPAELPGGGFAELVDLMDSGLAYVQVAGVGHPQGVLRGAIECHGGTAPPTPPPTPTPTVTPTPPPTPTASGRLSWWETCGDVVCRGYQASGSGACTGQQAGDRCQSFGQICDLVGNTCNVRLLCSDTDPRAGGCPISRREAKKDIHYLNELETKALSQELLGLPLVTYRYRDGDERVHLGFIIDDIEPSAAAHSQRGQVDLYGYTSMAVAALQQQARQIEALQRELDTLEQRLQEAKCPEPR
jgi:hypothetical protein